MLKNSDRSCPQCCIWKEDPLGQLVTQRNQVPPLGSPLWLPPTLVSSIISKNFHPFIFSFFHLSIFFRVFIHSASIQKKVRSVSRSVMSDSLRQGLQPTRLLCPWDFPGKNTEWVAISFSRGSSQPRDRTQVSCTAGRFFTNWTTRETQRSHIEVVLPWLKQRWGFRILPTYTPHPFLFSHGPWNTSLKP